MDPRTFTETDPLAIVLMVEPGYLEFQFICLVASLRKHCKTPFRIYPYCRADRVDRLTVITQECIAEHCKPIRTFAPEFAEEYPWGNKIYACADQRKEKVSLFLDTDMLMLRETDFAQIYRPGYVSVVLGSVSTWSTDPEDWTYLYSKFNLPAPKFMLARGADALGVPYYNGGMVLFDSDLFPGIWLETILSCEVDGGIANKRPWLDQVTLPIAIERAQLGTAVVTPHWNGRVAAADHERRGQHLLHYHKLADIGSLGFVPVFDDIAKSAMRFPSFISLLDALEDQGAASLRQRDLDKRKAAGETSKSIMRSELGLG